MDGKEVVGRYGDRTRIAYLSLSETPLELAIRAKMPFSDGFFDAVASVFLFHELPPRVQPAVAAELHRVLEPGGTGVLCDSAQLSDSAEIGDALHAFPAGYHEPYYKGSLRDDLAVLLEAYGFDRARTEPFLVSKFVVATKPSPASQSPSGSFGDRLHSRRDERALEDADGG